MDCASADMPPSVEMLTTAGMTSASIGAMACSPEADAGYARAQAKQPKMARARFDNIWLVPRFQEFLKTRCKNDASAETWR
jgi:hypothetical protein